MRDQELLGLQEAYMEVYRQLDEKEDSPYEKASDAALPNDEKEKDRVSFDAVRATYNRNKAIKDEYDLYELSDKKVEKTLRARERRFNRSIDSGAPNKEFHQLRRTEKLVASRNRRTGSNIPVDEEYADLYDIILSHLLDEGYAETPEAAEAIMVNMSEEWRDDIVEEVLDERNRGEIGMTDQQVRQRRDRRDGDITSGGYKPYVRAGGSQRSEHERNRGKKKTKSGYGRTQWQ